MAENLSSRRGHAAVLLILLMSVTPGLTLLLYSQTFIHSGIGAVSWWWTHGTYSDEVTLEVNESTPSASALLVGERLVIQYFNTSENIVSIVVTCDEEVILNRSRIAGTQVDGIMYPEDAPSGNVNRHFAVTAYWEGENTTVSFPYYFEVAMHADGAVYWTSPGYEEVRDIGYLVLLGGAILFIVILFVMTKRTR
ncbi:MAG: hypothetical protein ACFE7R_03190 [Candidatus Hodarchaeota archaeon]